MCVCGVICKCMGMLIVCVCVCVCGVICKCMGMLIVCVCVCVLYVSVWAC